MTISIRITLFLYFTKDVTISKPRRASTMTQHISYAMYSQIAGIQRLHQQ